MGILPMSRTAILALQSVAFYGRDARGIHGQDARATSHTRSTVKPNTVGWAWLPAHAVRPRRQGSMGNDLPILRFHSDSNVFGHLPHAFGQLLDKLGLFLSAIISLGRVDIEVEQLNAVDRSQLP